MDRERLKNIQQTDHLTDSKLNQDFVFWLKEHGVNWFLVVILVLCGWVMWKQWEQRGLNARDEAWQEFAGASTPASLLEVASKHGSVDSIGILAKLDLADQYLNSIVRGKRFDRGADAPDATITPELREQWLHEAGRLYSDVVATVGDNPEEVPKRLFAANARFGLAAVAESEGKFEDAKKHLEAAVAITRGHYDGLADRAEARLATLPQVAAAGELPSESQLPPPADPPVVPQAIVDELVLPAVGDSTSTPAP